MVVNDILIALNVLKLCCRDHKDKCSECPLYDELRYCLLQQEGTPPRDWSLKLKIDLN